MQITVNPSSIAFAGSPIIVTATNEQSDWSAASSPALRMVHIQTNVTVESKTYTHEFASEVSLGEAFVCDVSSAVRSAFHGIDYIAKHNASSSALFTSACTLSVSAYVSYMNDGSYFEGLGNVAGDKKTIATPLNVIPGALSEMERLTGTAVPTDGMSLSTKPNGECVTKGHKFLLARIDNGMPSLAYYSANSVGAIDKFKFSADPDVFIQRSAYVDNTPRTEFLFVNSRGVLEDASAVMLESMSVAISKTQFLYNGMPSYAPYHSTGSRRAVPRKQWEMSSGNVSREWAEWWVCDFLCSDQYWMKIADNWVPVSITPKSNTTQIYDRTKAQACHVDFTVTCSIRS